MYRMYGRNVFSCRNVNLYEKGMGATFRENDLGLIRDTHGSHDFLPSFPPSPLCSNMGQVCEICKRYGWRIVQYAESAIAISLLTCQFLLMGTDSHSTLGSLLGAHLIWSTSSSGGWFCRYTSNLHVCKEPHRSPWGCMNEYICRTVLFP